LLGTDVSMKTYT